MLLQSCVFKVLLYLVYSGLFNTILSIVAERKLSTQKNFINLQLGNQLTVSCINEHLFPGILVSWLDSNGLYYSTNNTLVIPSLHPSHNNTIYTCIVSIQDNPTGCLNQSREFVIIEKSKNYFFQK